MNSSYPFPKDFVWGAAAASFTTEGAPFEDDKGQSIWDRFSHTPGRTHNGDTGDVACDFYHRYTEDIDLMRALGLQAFRFSISWPRVMPDGRGQVNEKGLRFYDSLIDGLLAAGIAPVATIYHWDLPQALQDRGGWANPETAEALAEFAGLLFNRFGDRVKTWITLNEPWIAAHFGHCLGIQAPGISDPQTAMRTVPVMLRAHGLAVRRFRESGTDGRIGITLNFSPIHPASDRQVDTRAAERFFNYHNRLFLDPVLGRPFPDELPEITELLPAIPADDLRVYSEPVDFLGVNYYSRQVVCDNPSDALTGVAGIRPDKANFTDMGWEIYPEGLYEVLIWLNEHTGGMPLYITESGAAFQDEPDEEGFVDDSERISYLSEHFNQAAKAVAAGVDLRGYFVYTLMDSFECECGYSKKFGLVRVEHPSLRRTIKASGRWYKRFMAGYS